VPAFRWSSKATNNGGRDDRPVSRPRFEPCLCHSLAVTKCGMRLACNFRHLTVPQNLLLTIFGDVTKLTLILLTWKIWCANNASKWQMVFNSEFEGLMRVFLSWFPRNRQGSIEPVPDKWRKEGPPGATRRWRDADNAYRKGLRPSQGTPRREYSHITLHGHRNMTGLPTALFVCLSKWYVRLVPNVSVLAG
jgi:hypothetical protein